MESCEPSGFVSLMRANRALRVIRGCNKVLAKCSDIQSFLTETCRIIVDEGAFRMAWIGFVEHDSGKTISIAAKAGFDAGYLENLNITWADTERGRGPTGKAIRSGKVMVGRDLENDPNFAPWRENAIKRGYYSSICVPFFGENRLPIGVLNIYSSERDAFDREEVDLMVELADDIGYGINVFSMKEKQRITQAALRESELSYHDLFDAADDFVYTYDLKRRLTTVNLSAMNRLGYSLEEVLGHKLEELVAEEFREQALEMMRRKMDNTGTSTLHELDFVARDGSRVPVEIISRLIIRDGRPVGGMAVARDISKRRKAELALQMKEMDLQKSRKSLQALLDASHEAAVLLDSEHTILACNDNYARMLGMENSNQMLHRTVSDFLTSDDGEVCLGNLDSIAVGQKPVSYRKEFRGVRYDFSVYPVADEGSWAIFARDVTREEEAEKAMAESERKTTAAIIASGVAHEFNNINSIISGNLYLVTRQTELPAKARSRLEKVMRMAARAGSITENLLAFTRRERSARSRSSLNEVVTDVLQLATSKRNARDIRIKFNGPSIPKFSMDAGQISQVIMNLVINASHAMQNIEDKMLAIELGIRSDQAFVRITDNGCGIEEDNLDHIFTPFFTTKKPQVPSDSEDTPVHGTGLGLSVCEKIVHDHNGSIEVMSTKGKGTSFTVWLPMEDAEVPDVKAETGAVEGSRIGGTRVLVVDDEPDIREMVRCLLETEGYEVIEAEDAGQALKIIRTTPCSVALVDLLMPGMTGVDFIKALDYLPVQKRPVCLLLTGVLSDTVAHESGDLNIYATVRKPFEIEDLMRVVNKAMAFAQKQI